MLNAHGTQVPTMLSNECHACENYIEFPDQGIGQEIRCPHCGAAVVLTATGKTTPAESEVPAPPPTPVLHAVEPKAYAKGEDLRPTEATATQVAAEPVIEVRSKRGRMKIPLGPVLITLGIILVLSAVLLAARHKAREAEAHAAHAAAIDKVEAEATVVRAPRGLFGAKWLMSAREVKAAAPAAKEVAPGLLTESRNYYERAATIGYHLTNDTLLLCSVTFAGPSTPENFNQVQTRLIKEYGRMPAAHATNGCKLYSAKRIDHFYVQHCLADSPAQTEQVFFYLGKGGDPKLMPKVAAH